MLGKETLGDKCLKYTHVIISFGHSLKWKTEDKFGFGCLIQLEMKWKTPNHSKSLTIFFPLALWKAIYLFIYSRYGGIYPSFFLSIFSSFYTVGEGQNKGHSNSLYLLQFCKLEALENTLFLSAAKRWCHGNPLSYPLREKGEYVSPCAKWVDTVTLTI